MKFTRILACLAVSLVGAGGLALSLNSAATATQTHFTVDTPVGGGHGYFSVEGRVVDQGGRIVQNADVTLFKASNTSTTPNASAQTYPGFFRFVDLTRGHFTIHISKSGYNSTTTDLITVGPRNPQVKEGEILLQKKLEDSTTRVTLTKDTIKVGDPAKGTIKVTTGGAPSTGKWQLFVDGDKEDSGKLAKSDEGKVAFSVSGLGKGTHKFQASFAGNIYVKDSDSNRATLTVVKKKR